MGYQNREYFRTGSSGSYSGGMDAPVCRRLLIATIVVFLLQIFSVRTATTEEAAAHREQQEQMLRKYSPRITDEELESYGFVYETPRVSVAQEWLQLETDKVLHGQIWRLLTSAFCHDRLTLWHILMNMLFFWWFGPTLESMYGSREFLLFYLTAAVVSSLAYVGLDLMTGNPSPMIGASGAVMAVTSLYAHHFPTHIIRIFFIFPIEIRWLVWIYALIDLHPVLLQLSGESFSDGVAHAAHLGGFAFGYFYGRQRWNLSSLLTAVQSRLPQREPLPPRDIIPFPRRASAPSRLDEILEKIHESGEESLNDDEREVLLQESERLKRRR